MNKVNTGYGSAFGGKSLLPKVDLNQGYGSFLPRPPALPESFTTEQNYGSSNSRVIPSVLPPAPILTEADTLCQGQRPETVIPLDGGRRFIVCLDEAKGVELKCPKGLLYHPETRRCERRLGPLENLCVSQPCLNGGQCIPTDSSYQCQCAAGYDGKTCELDATVCQSQQPCGQAPDARCQSYRVNAALTYICIFQDGAAYGFNSQQIQRNPCQGVDGPRSLDITDKGFIMCDGDRMFIDSCPGGTIWDDLNKACSWPDLQGVVGIAPADEQSGYDASSYGSQIKDTVKPLALPQPKSLESYGQSGFIRPPMNPFPSQPISGGKISVQQPKPVESYGQTSFVRPSMLPFTSSGQASIQQQPRPVESFSKGLNVPSRIFTQPSGYGSQIPKVFPTDNSGY